jgi:hypothetical protein
MDFITDLPTSSQGHDSILVFVDKLTKFVHIAPMNKTCSAEEAAQLFIWHIFQYHGIPQYFITDRDGRFTSNFWKSFCEKVGIEHRYSTSFHPQTDGTTERMNRVVEEVMRGFVNEEHNNWEELIPLVTFAINNSKCDATGETPFFLNTGTHPTTINTAFIPTDKLPKLDGVIRDLYQTLDEVKLLYRVAQDRNSKYANTKRQESPFKAGDLVLLSTRNMKFKKGTRKLHPKFVGPFPIKRMINEVAAELELPKSYKIHRVFHVSLLKPFKSDGTFKPLPPNPQIVEGVPFYKVEKIEKILDTRTKKLGRRKRVEYLIKWEGYDHTHNSWEPEANLTPDLIMEYQRK